mgnify:CR=1 FL=1
MVNKTIIKSLIVSFFLIFLVLIAGRVYSQSLEVSGNASGSNNSININQSNSNTVNQSNSANVNNNANATSDTGGNSINDGVGGGSIRTGDATSNVNITNQFNSNVRNVSATPTPTPKPSPTPIQQIGGPTSTPTPNPSGNGGNGGGDGGDGGDGGEGGAPQAPAVLGLSAASGESSLFKIIPGLISILLGFNLLRKKC